MDIEELRQNWQRAKIKCETLEAENRRLARELATGRATTVRDRLSRHYLRSALSALVILPLFSPLLVHVLNFPLWAAILYAVFGIIIGIINLWFSQYIKHSDYTSVSIIESLAKAEKIARYQRNIEIFAIVFCLVVLITMFSIMIDINERDVLLGFFIGLAIGIVIAIKKYLYMHSLTRQMQQELKSLAEE